MTDELDELRDELAEFAAPKKIKTRSAREERIIAGFEEIQRFVEEHGRRPQHGEDTDIFERIYAIRLDRLNQQDDCRELLRPHDRQGLLSEAGAEVDNAEVDDDALMAELEDIAQHSDLTELRNVRTAEERRAAEQVARRTACADFARFKPLFDTVQAQLENGERQTRAFELKAEIETGAWFIVGGLKAYVAGKDDVFTNDQGRTDARLRVIFDNGTESNMLMRSLQRALNADVSGRRITDPIAGPLFSDKPSEGDEASGTIYVLRSRSDLPLVAENRQWLHKIGVTNRDVEQRVAGARLQPTFLMADVDIVATYELFNVNRAKLENLIHRIFAPGQLDIEVKDRFGTPVRPREWFLVPLNVINEAVDRIRDGSITSFVYDPKTAALRRKDLAT